MTYRVHVLYTVQVHRIDSLNSTILDTVPFIPSSADAFCAARLVSEQNHLDPQQCERVDLVRPFHSSHKWTIYVHPKNAIILHRKFEIVQNFKFRRIFIIYSVLLSQIKSVQLGKIECKENLWFRLNSKWLLTFYFRCSEWWKVRTAIKTQWNGINSINLSQMHERKRTKNKNGMEGCWSSECGLHIE